MRNRKHTVRLTDGELKWIELGLWLAKEESNKSDYARHWYTKQWTDDINELDRLYTRLKNQRMRLQSRRHRIEYLLELLKSK